MKKVYYILAFVVAALTVTACTEEEVKPAGERQLQGTGLVIEKM